MFCHEALYLHLTADAALVAEIDTRIFPGFLAQKTLYPAVAYREVGRTPLERMEERGHAGMSQYRFRFFSTTNMANGGYDTAKQVDELIRLALHGFKGEVTDLTSSPVETFYIDGIFHRGTVDGYHDETETYQVISDYDVWAEEVQPT